MVASLRKTGPFPFQAQPGPGVDLYKLLQEVYLLFKADMLEEQPHKKRRQGGSQKGSSRVRAVIAIGKSSYRRDKGSKAQPGNIVARFLGPLQFFLETGTLLMVQFKQCVVQCMIQKVSYSLPSMICPVRRTQEALPRASLSTPGWGNGYQRNSNILLASCPEMSCWHQRDCHGFIRQPCSWAI